MAERITLSYDRLSYKYALTYLGIGIILLLFVFLIPHIGTPSRPDISQWLPIVGFIAFVCILLAIWDALFTLNHRTYIDILEFDDDALYVTEPSGRKSAVSYQDITAVRLTGGGGQGIKGRWRVYAIDYQSNDERKKTIDVSIFTSNMPRLGEFQQAVQAANRFTNINNSWSPF